MKILVKRVKASNKRIKEQAQIKVKGQKTAVNQAAGHDNNSRTVQQSRLKPIQANKCIESSSTIAIDRNQRTTNLFL